MASKSKKKNWFSDLFYKGVNFDYILLFIVVFLTGFGLLMVYSASSYRAYVLTDDSAYFFKRDLFLAAVGFAGMIIISFVKYQKLRKLATPLYFITLGALLLVKIVGESSNGSTRWIKIGPIQLQPSEFAKLILVIFMARLFAKYGSRMETFWQVTRYMILCLPIVGLIVIENLSTAIICCAIVGGIWFAYDKHMWHGVVYIIIGIAAGLLMISLKSYRSGRIEAFLHPETAGDAGYQTLQGLYAIGTGGLFGRGLGESVQKMGYLPEPHTDMIFSIICEELGIIGAVGVIIVFVILIWRLKYIAEGAKDAFGGLMVVGIIAHISIQTIMNICVVTKLMPNTGVPLPFISYGGSSLIATLWEIGLALSVSRQIVPHGETKEV